ncbi:MAG: tetratricopeptide repeat protein [Promethearchaeota archaeon]
MSDFIKKIFDLDTRDDRLNYIIIDCNRRLKLNPHSIEVLTQLAEAYNLTSQYKKAVSICKEILKLEQDYRPALNNLFFAYDRLEDFNQVLKIFDSYLRKFKLEKKKELQDLSFSLLLKNYFKDNKTEPFLEIYLPPHYPSNVIDINFSTAFHFSKIGWSLQSSDILRNSLEKYPQDIDLWNSLGFSFYLEGKFDEAKIAFDKALEIDDKNDMTHYLLGSFYLRNNELEKAKMEFRIVIANFPISWNRGITLIEESTQNKMPNIQALNSLGETYIKCGEYEEAITTLSKALALTNLLFPLSSNLFKKSSKSYFLSYIYKNLGIAYYSLDDIKKALKMFKKSLKNDPENVENLEYLGTINFEIKKYKNATEIFQHVVEIKPEDPLGWHMLSKSYYRSGNTENAKEANLRCLGLDPNHKSAIDLRKVLLGG